MLNLVKRYWLVLRRPSRYFSLGVLTVGGFVLGVLFWGGFNTALDFTNREAFCIGCHEMRDNVYQELQGTIHFTNRSGVRAKCADCHVPHEWTAKMARKMAASKEVWGKIFGTISTREKFVDLRPQLALNEWRRLKANNSLECRNCHEFEYMDFTRQSVRASNAHSTSLHQGERTCIDCHIGIAHRMPDVQAVARAAQARGIEPHELPAFLTGPAAQQESQPDPQQAPKAAPPPQDRQPRSNP